MTAKKGSLLHIEFQRISNGLFGHYPLQLILLYGFIFENFTSWVGKMRNHPSSLYARDPFLIQTYLMMDKSKYVLLISLVALLSSCGKPDVEGMGLGEFSTSQFSEADLAILNGNLNLTGTVYNYANPDLPQHLNNEELLEMDNTPEDNPTTDMGATLGRVLFYDVNLSVNNTISCASCHQQAFGFSDPDQFSSGFDGGKTRRNSMGLANSRYYSNGRFGWDEKAASLEEFVLLPVQDHVEMGMDLGELERKLQQLDYYPVLFRNAFGDENITSDRISRALAQFVRSIFSHNSKFDQGIADAGYPLADDGMPFMKNFTPQEKLGQDIFYNGRGETNCKYCHETAVFSIEEARNNGLATQYDDNGKGEITGNSEHNGVFKIPSLRNIGLTAPYMHDGRFQTLEEVVDHYTDGVAAHPSLHPRLSTLNNDDGPLGSTPRQLSLNQVEKDALVAFLHTLTDPTLATEAKYSDPFQ